MGAPFTATYRVAGPLTVTSSDPTEGATDVDASQGLTFNLSAPLSQGKVQKAEAFARERGISLEHSYFYGDSQTDAPMLARVGHPCAVQPDAQLRREAKRRGWPILDWR